MGIKEIRRFFTYNYWANARILDAAAELSEEKFTAAVRLSHGSLRATLVHILAAEQIWRVRCQEGVSPSDLLHIVNHGTQFRSEAGVYLTELDRSPGGLDFIAFQREWA